jgi:small subunit ribosomal protein S13
MRIAGITIPDNKRLEIGLTAVYGMGRKKVLSVLSEAKVDPGARPGDLTPQEENDIRSRIEAFSIEGELRRSIAGNIKRLKDIQSLRGIRHARGQKVRGQRTRTNNRIVPSGVAATHKARRTMTSGRRKVEKK